MCQEEITAHARQERAKNFFAWITVQWGKENARHLRTITSGLQTILIISGHLKCCLFPWLERGAR